MLINVHWLLLLPLIVLQGIESTGISFTNKLEGSTAMLTLLWSSPGYRLPSGEIRIVAVDKNNAITSRRISIILCACMNNGNCSAATDSTLLNAQGHHKLLCDCPLYYGGDSCQIEMRGCGFNVCPDYANCENDSSVDSGYTCSNCSVGYEVMAISATDMENKCVGKFAQSGYL